MRIRTGLDRPPPRATRLPLVLTLVLLQCGGGETGTATLPGAPIQGQPLPDSTFAALSARVSEPGGYFDTDNLISNESGYLKVLPALDRLGIRGGAYVGVGPDQNFSYIAALRPELAFIIDIRRDNLLHHLLLKALVERSPTRVQFLAGLLGRPAPSDTTGWRDRNIDEIAAFLDRPPLDSADVSTLLAEIRSTVQSYGIPLDSADLATIRRFHQAFIRDGLDLRFTSRGRAPRPQYPTYRRLVTETDREGTPSSYLSSAERYAVVRRMELENRVIPVVGDLAGDHALREMAGVLREMGLRLTAFYTSNVEFYLWQAGSFPEWLENLGALPATPDAVVIRSYFPNSGGIHPSAVPGYYATQSLQPVDVLRRGGFGSYFDLVTRGTLDLGKLTPFP